MRAVVQRVSEARVTVEDQVVGAIDRGFVVLLGITASDGADEVAWLVDKVTNLRVFDDDAGKMNLSLAEVSGSVLLVSQFTIYGDARKGRRPSFVRAAKGPAAERIYDEVAAGFRRAGRKTETGRFGADMKVSLTNDGPVTILLDSEKTF